MKTSWTGRSRVTRWAVLTGGGVFLVMLVLQLSIWPVFECQRYMIRSEMKARLLRCVPAEDLVVFRFTPEEYTALDFEDGGREVRINGAMHDIVHTAPDADGTILVQVVRDDAETALLSSLDRNVHDQQGRDTRGQQQRRVLAAMWAGFYEQRATAWLLPPGVERCFPGPQLGIGRVAESADPGPPRLG